MDEKDNSTKEIMDFQRRLVAWFHADKRDMPWRSDPSPYRVWVSEVMLQQTRVDTVIPYFNRFIERLPTVEDLAEVEEGELMKLWEGLGYYSRVRNMQTTAREIVDDHGGEFPRTALELRKFKGIGAYTAGAVASIAFDDKAAAVDGNVFRVMARLTANHGDLRDLKVQKELTREVERVLPDESVGDFNQALIELGALVCISKGSPKCPVCPVISYCEANRLGIQDILPYKSKAKEKTVEEKTVFLIQCGDRFAIRQRPKERLLGGLFELPNVPGFLTPEEAAEVLTEWELGILSVTMMKPAKVLFTHIQWNLRGLHIVVEKEAGDLVWATREEALKSYAFASAFSFYLSGMEGPEQLSLLL
ncbi:MAG TPA: A/G-specific adenine glycosylase [Clostridiaceae bacterium]|nr:A/G-specific adenine glycosylase [Clostridiaceae bacterium]